MSAASSSNLGEELTALRYRLARDKGMSASASASLKSMSLDNIFNDKVLSAIVEAQPRDMEALGRVPGFSSAKLEKFGEQVLAVCQESRKRGMDEHQDADSKRQACGKGLREDQLTAEQQKWARAAIGGQSLFLTGEAGTGKSFLLSYIIQELKKLKMVAVTASTGIAAASLGGSTVHSFAGVGLGNGDPVEVANRVLKNVRTRSRWQEVKVLVIDEISMLDAHFFNLLEYVARRARGNEEPWGGLQLLLCGDFLQLPPVESSGFAFETEAWRKTGLEIAELSTPMRQQDDKAFFSLLSEVRIGLCSASTAQRLASCSVATKPLPPDGIAPTKLYCVNKDVDAENISRLAQLKEEMHEIRAVDSWKSVPESGRAKLLELVEKAVPEVLQLKVEAQVIFTKNDPSQGVVNGTRGQILSWSDKMVQGMRCPVVRCDDGRCLTVEPATHTQSDSQGTGELNRLQLPLKLGWALTVHRAQGCTISRAELQLENAFYCGQVYVALSRVKTLNGLWIKGKPVGQKEVKAHPAVLEFYFA